MSYIEQGIYKYFRRIFFSGLDELFSRKWVLFTLFTILFLILSTIDYLNIQEIAFISSRIQTIFATAFILTAFSSMKFKKTGVSFVIFASILYLSSPYINTIAELALSRTYFVAWIILLNFITLLLIKDFISSWSGYVLFLGNPKGRVVFRPIFNLVILSTIVYSLYSISLDVSLNTVSLLISALVLWIVNYNSKKHKNYEIFGTIIGFFFLNFAYHFAVMKNPPSYSIFVDLAIIIFGILFASKRMAMNLFKKTNNQAFSIFLMMGLLLGYHNTLMRTNFISNPLITYHLFSFITSGIIISIVALVFMHNREFRTFMTEKKEIKGKEKIIKIMSTLISNKMNSGIGE